jgi:hypothetical protein
MPSILHIELAAVTAALSLRMRPQADLTTNNIRVRLRTSTTTGCGTHCVGANEPQLHAGDAAWLVLCRRSQALMLTKHFHRSSGLLCGSQQMKIKVCKLNVTYTADAKLRACSCCWATTHPKVR